MFYNIALPIIIMAWKYILLETDLTVVPTVMICAFWFHCNSLLLLAWNMAKSSSKLKVKFGSSSLLSPITFSVKTFTAETSLTFAAMRNSTCHAIDTETCVSGEIHHSNNYCYSRSNMADTLCHKWISSECILRMINLMHECGYSFLLLTIKNQWLNITTFQAATT